MVNNSRENPVESTHRLSDYFGLGPEDFNFDPFLFAATAQPSDPETEVARFLIDVQDAVRQTPRRSKERAVRTAWLPHLLEKGFALLSGINDQLQNDFAMRMMEATSNPSGSGFESNANFGDLAPQLKHLRQVVIGLGQLTRAAKKRASRDIRDDLERVLRRDKAQVIEEEEVNWTRVCESLWVCWNVGYRWPSKYVSWSEADAEIFGEHFYVNWTDYLEEACRYRKTKSGESIKRSAANKHFENVWADVKRGMLLWIQVHPELNDIKNELRQKPNRGRHGAQKKGELEESVIERFREEFISKQPVVGWKCENHCDDSSLNLTPLPKKECRKFDRYVCPRWYRCGGVLRPLFVPPR